MTDHREKQRRIFDKEYQRLNPKQREAVDTIEGPVMVIAGPGTGKTQILAARIGKILLETDVYPQNILCLTYTEAGVVAMRRRLFQFIGAAAYKVNVFTFHAFCNEIIQENISLFDKHELNPITDLESSRLLRELIDDLPKGNLLKRYKGDVYYEVKRLSRLFATMKKEGWTPEFINDHIDEHLEGIKTQSEYIYSRPSKKSGKKPGDFKSNYYDEVDRMEKLRAATLEFPKYLDLMKRDGYYDFDDMINWVIRIFRERKDVLEYYQEKYQYILVDEYQDTSGTQNELVNLLISYWDEPNVFVVGDDDQSIFRFQGANVENMTNLAKSYESLVKIVLENNYRSTQPILDVAEALIDKNTERLTTKMPGLTKRLITSNKELLSVNVPVDIVSYRTMRDEMADITGQIEKLVADGIKPGDIAVIAKENAYASQIMRYLILKNIPAYSKKSINLLTDTFIRKLITLLNYLAEEHEIPYSGDRLLFEIMHFDFFKIPPIETAKLSVETNRKAFSNSPTSIRKLLVERTQSKPGELFDSGAPKELKDFSRMLESLLASVSNETLPKLFEKLINTGGILKYILRNEDKILLFQKLTVLFDFIKEECSRKPLMNISELVEVFDSMNQENISLPFFQTLGSEDGVNLLTVHGSKGLEFKYVFIAGMISGLWEKKRLPHSTEFKLPPNLFSSNPEGSTEEELRRLFYVALTRTKTHLQVSYFRFNTDDKEMEQSMFLAEIMEEGDLEVGQKDLGAEELMQFEILNYTESKPRIEEIEQSFITPLVEKYVMNATSLNNYLDCPLAFYYRNLIRIPSGKSENMEFGSAIHYALQYLFEDMQKDPAQQFPPAKKVCDRFAWYMKRHRENFTPAGFDRFLEYGEKILTDYYDQYLHQWNKIVSVERNIKGVVIDGIPLRGKVDKMEFKGKDVNVVDYKTGNPKSPYTKQKLNSPDEKQPDGGDYWRQAVFYKILIDNMDGKDWKVMSTEFDFIEPTKDGTYINHPISVGPEDLATVKHQIKEVWEKIQAHDFYTGCGKEDCTWCNLVKDNDLAVEFSEPVEEEEI